MSAAGPANEGKNKMTAKSIPTLQLNMPSVLFSIETTHETLAVRTTFRTICLSDSIRRWLDGNLMSKNSAELLGLKRPRKQ